MPTRGRPSIMGAGLGGATKYNLDVNGNQGGGPVKQGLPPVRNKRVEFNLRRINQRAGSNSEQRAKVYCINQIGGIGAVGSGNTSRTFATLADGTQCKLEEEINNVLIEENNNEEIEDDDEIESSLCMNIQLTFNPSISFDIAETIIISFVESINYNSTENIYINTDNDNNVDFIHIYYVNHNIGYSLSLYSTQFYNYNPVQGLEIPNDLTRNLDLENNTVTINIKKSSCQIIPTLNCESLNVALYIDVSGSISSYIPESDENPPEALLLKEQNKLIKYVLCKMGFFNGNSNHLLRIYTFSNEPTVTPINSTWEQIDENLLDIYLCTIYNDNYGSNLATNFNWIHTQNYHNLCLPFDNLPTNNSSNQNISLIFTDGQPSNGSNMFNSINIINNLCGQHLRAIFAYGNNIDSICNIIGSSESLTFISNSQSSTFQCIQAMKDIIDNSSLNIFNCDNNCKSLNEPNCELRRQINYEPNQGDRIE